MRILIYTPHYLPGTRQGGPVQSVHGLARVLVSLGHEVTVITTDMDGSDRLHVPLDHPVIIDGVEVHYFPIRWPKRFYYCPSMLRRAKVLIPRMDVIHINGVFLWPGPRIMRVAQREGVPVVLSPRGMLLPELVAGRSRLIKQAWIMLEGRSSLSKAAALHVTSAAEEEGLRKLGLDLVPMKILPNGVALPRSPSAALIAQVWEGVPEGRRVLYLGRLAWNKGIDMAIVATRAHKDAYILIAGHDETSLRQKLERELERADGSRCGVFVGQVDGQEKWALLSGADVLLVPSVQENFANVVAEAMAVGTPVIATEGVGAAVYLAKVDPELVIPREQDKLTASLAELLSDPGRRDQVAAAGRKIAAAEFDWSVIAGRMVKIYREAEA